MKRQPKKKRKGLGEAKHDGGFTLVEVIVAIGILSFGILAVATMQVSAIRGNAVAEWDTEATTWAGDQIENLACLAWDDALLQDADGDGVNGLDDTGFDNNAGTAGDGDHAPVVQGRYTIQWNVADNVLIGNTKTVHVIVTWTDRGVAKRVTLRRAIPRII
jgi:type IV pilus assembly protein PilV